MNILFLDTASKENLLAICNEEKTLALAHLTQKGDGEIVPAIENALKKAKLTYDDLTHVASSIGPGGFTSLRVGVTAINTLSYSLNIPSTGIHLSGLWAARVKKVVVARERPLPQSPNNFLWLHSTRRTQLFVKGFAADGTTTPCALFDLEDAAELCGQYVGELIEEHQKALTGCTPMPKENLLSLEEMLPGYLSNLKYQKQQLLPWYGREG